MSKKTIIFIGLPLTFIVIIVLFVLFNPVSFWKKSSNYKTQEIIYRNKANKNSTIEFQMQDIGAFGYNRRIVKVTKGIFFDSAILIDTSLIDKSKWNRVDEYKNEIGFKGG